MPSIYIPRSLATDKKEIIQLLQEDIAEADRSYRAAELECDRYVREQRRDRDHVTREKQAAIDAILADHAVARQERLAEARAPQPKLEPELGAVHWHLETTENYWTDEHTRIDMRDITHAEGRCDSIADAADLLQLKTGRPGLRRWILGRQKYAAQYGRLPVYTGEPMVDPQRDDRELVHRIVIVLTD